jgi:hypothetical protein
LRGDHGLFGWNWRDITAGLPQPTTATKQPGLPWISAIVVNPRDSNEAWVAIEGVPGTGGIWHSTDGGDTWTNVTGNLGNIQTTTLTEGDGTLYAGVPGDVVACSSCEGTSPQPAWKALGAGLPRTWITDLSYTGSDLIAWTFGRGAWDISTN